MKYLLILLLLASCGKSESNLPGIDKQRLANLNDSDGDGVNDEKELELGTNPYIANFPYIRIKLDSDFKFDFGLNESQTLEKEVLNIKQKINSDNVKIELAGEKGFESYVKALNNKYSVSTYGRHTNNLKLFLIFDRSLINDQYRIESISGTFFNGNNEVYYLDNKDIFESQELGFELKEIYPDFKFLISNMKLINQVTGKEILYDVLMNQISSKTVRIELNNIIQYISRSEFSTAPSILEIKKYIDKNKEIFKLNERNASELNLKKITDFSFLESEKNNAHNKIRNLKTKKTFNSYEVELKDIKKLSIYNLQKIQNRVEIENFYKETDGRDKNGYLKKIGCHFKRHKIYNQLSQEKLDLKNKDKNWSKTILIQLEDQIYNINELSKIKKIKVLNEDKSLLIFFDKSYDIIINFNEELELKDTNGIYFKELKFYNDPWCKVVASTFRAMEKDNIKINYQYLLTY